MLRDERVSEKHFLCTACGKCCYGEVPLTIEDALANADRFPLAMVWTPVSEGMKAFNLVGKLGATVELPNRKRVAVLIAPTAYIPPQLPCPALGADNLCSIHDTKPLRCRAMPFYAYREEEDQADLLVPRKGWECDVSPAAPLVYKDKQIIERADFDKERAALLGNAVALNAYAQRQVKNEPALLGHLMAQVKKPVGGRFTVKFAPFLLMNKQYDMLDFAQKQHPVLASFAAHTANNPAMADHHRYYTQAAEDLAWFAERAKRPA